MCYGCWCARGKPAKVTPEVIAAAEAVGHLYDFSAVGGVAHVVTDDWNLEAWVIKSCLKDAREDDHWSAKIPGALEAGINALEKLLALPIKQRAAALAFWNGWIDTDGKETPDPNAGKPPPYIIFSRA